MAAIAASVLVPADVPGTKKQWEDVVMEMKQQKENVSIIEALKSQMGAENRHSDATNKFKIIEEYMNWTRAKLETTKADDFTKGMLESKAVQSLERNVRWKAYRMWNRTKSPIQPAMKQLEAALAGLPSTL